LQIVVSTLSSPPSGKPKLVSNGIANPSLGCHAGDGNETHAGHAADHIQDFRDSPNLLDGLDFGFDIDRHNDLSVSPRFECNA
jgi:hypothetical protein